MGRTKNEKYGWDISLTKRNAHYFINDMEIPVQAMDTTAMEIGLFDRVYAGSGTLYTRLGYKMGTGWFGAKPDTDNPASPKTHYKMWLLDIDWQKPLPWDTGRHPSPHPFTGSGRQAACASTAQTW